MKQVSHEKGNRVYAYCVMPDHVHILLDASEKCGIIDFVRITKGRFAAEWRECYSTVREEDTPNQRKPGLLQQSFYDHILRKDEDVMEIARYIIGNPVRRGIAEEMGRYPFAGSLVYDL